EVAYITLSSFRVNPEFQDFFSSTDRVVCEVIHIRRVDGGALRVYVRTPAIKGWYFKDGSTQTGVHASKPPTYPTHQGPVFSVNLEIPPFNGWCSNVDPLPGLRTVSGG
ncbi:hypothetical protein QYE93_26185, partial [Enterobacter cloacae subsp. cloacae]|uniref:hypothetical protein n=1 Tax=Enterobacter cloacae TaxID=550 RepID=UPI002875FD8B